MNLIDILVEELPKIGGWPEGVCEISTHASGRVFFDGRFAPRGFSLPMASDAWNKYKHPHSYTNAVTREQYEAALAAKNEGWIEWGGGKHPPVSTNTVVDVKLEKGYVQSGYPAGEYSWEHVWQGSNIIAYRLHQPQEEVKAKADDEADLNECIGQDAAPVWNGEGLPPVGAKVVFFINPLFEYATQGMPAEGCEIEVVAHKKTSDGNDVAVCYWDENGGGRAVCLVPESLIPAKSEAVRKRDEAVKTIMLTGWCQSAAEEIYDLVATGKVPGMKMED